MQIERRELRRKEIYEWLVLLASLSLIGGVLAGLQLAGIQLCMLRKHTGIPCPLCGSSRAGMMLLQGRFADAFALQPLASLMMPAFGVGALVYTHFLFIRREVLTLRISAKERNWILLLAGLLAVANWIYLLLHGVA